ncbi:MAG: chemotaxis protein CheA [Burkholderiaceae bacterium]
MSASTADDESFLREALPAFLSESRELLDQLEQLLLELEIQPDDRELLDALFRCAHTIKGSAGLFGLDAVVGFTHHVEGFLDAVREGTVRLAPSVNSVLLRCADQIRRLLGELDGQMPTGGPIDDEREVLVAALASHLPSGAAHGASLPGAGARSATGLDGAVATATALHRVRLQFAPDTFRDGFDPLAILEYLATLGTLSDTAIDDDRLPEFDEFDAETCHLDLTTQVSGPLDASRIEGAFDMVREDCAVQVEAIGDTRAAAATEVADPDAVMARIADMDAKPRIGEILVAAGAIDRAQLDDALAGQFVAATNGTQPPQIGALLHQNLGVPKQVIDAAARKQRHRDGDDTRTVRVPADRLDAVINLLGELVIAGAGTALLAQKTGVSESIESSHHLGRLIEEVRNGTLQLRMVPIGETFARFRRVVRDVAADLGKDVQLDIVGGETELDKSVVERIADPLMHLVRNALDHGLETAAEREAAGKPAQGRLTLAAAHESGGILIRIVDDGRGIQREKVLRRAWERGLIDDGVVPANDDEVLNLIFEPGFSTAETVTNLSGRGVGMDVVRRNIEALRGNVSITSEPGAGSTIEIRLPLTLAIIDGFMVGVGDSKFIVPLESVVEVIEHRAVAATRDARGRSVVELRGRMLPVVDLRALYGLDGPASERGSIVVLQSGTQRYGIRVDALLGQHQTVIKPLGRMFRSLRGMSGSSILGTGEVALIFDVASLGQLAERPPRSQPAPFPAPLPPSGDAQRAVRSPS